MEIKKSYEADLENEKSNFILMGLLIAVCAIFIAFEWSQRDLKPVTKDEGIQMEEIEEESAPITEQNTPPPPPPPAPEPVVDQMPTEFKKDDKAETKSLNLNTEDEGKAVEDAKPILDEPVQVVEEEDNDNQIYIKVQKKAEYPGGMNGLRTYLAKNLVYPKAARETGMQGTVIVQVTVEKNGTVTDVEVVRSIDPALDKEAVRVVKLMKGWSPAQNGTKNVRSKFKLPVAFKIG
ncbi:MAG: TonB family protein [Paludibacteraceae bacterium]|nr:TonB family protein [Paludibacteraceae bacterium]